MPSDELIQLQKAKFEKMQTILESKKADIQHLCKSLNIDRLYAFGSVVSNRFADHSDIDFLIAFNDNLTVEEYTSNYFSLQYSLRALLNREIDIVIERTLSNPYLIESINETKELIYEA